MSNLPITLDRLDDISERYRVILCDVWGVVHNGVHVFADAIAALQRARQAGKIVVLVTNAPRPRREVEVQLRALGVPADAYDRLVTSGDATRDLIRSGPRRVYHLGAERDLSLFEGIDVELVEEPEASAVICTGFVDDETEGPDDYAEMLMRFRTRDLPMVCANPDIVVERGDRLVWCAGALARDYGLRGGRTLIAGKPHRPIYELALAEASEIAGEPIGAGQALAIGDGMLTDIKGAAQNDIDALYISGGIHAREYGEPGRPDPERLAAFLAKHGHDPVAVMPHLR